MRPIDNETLTKLRAKLAEAREAEYRCVIEVANAQIGYAIETKLDELHDAQKVTADVESLINLLARDGAVKTGNTEGDIYTQGAPMPPETLGDW